ncbi:MAG: methyltransferase domain-containing protein, partial [Chloroflexota bacterium]|nr:methyltransferase domain-containing protein [Chloroflexota bacterium]
MPVELDDEYLRFVAHHKFKEPERRQMVDGLELEPGDRVLDLGCGLGLWSAWFAEEVAPDGRVVGVDVNPASISIARGRTRSDPHSDVIEYLVGDARAIPFEGGARRRRAG